MGIRQKLEPAIGAYLKIQAVSHLKKTNRLNTGNKRMKVGFLTHEPQTFDKTEPLFAALNQREDCEALIYVVPSFNTHFAVRKEYGNEWEYFNRIYPGKCIRVYENGKLIDLKKQKLDYLFYTDPNMGHFEYRLRSYFTSAYAKLCYIPYSFLTSKSFGLDLIDMEKRFYQNLSFVFCDTESTRKKLQNVLPDAEKNGQRFLNIGYPALGVLMKQEKDTQEQFFNIQWTPRWSYAEVGGGSHFLEYKDQMMHLKEINDQFHLSIRPHPLLFSNMVRSGKMTEQEIEEYKRELRESDVIMDDNSSPVQAIAQNDIFITDFTGMMMELFLSGKPIIYCKGGGIEFTDELQPVEDSLYLADSWQDIVHYLSELGNGNDPKRKERMALIHSDLFTIHTNAVDHIIRTLLEDFHARKS